MAGQTTQTRRILIKIDSDDSQKVKDIANKLGDLNKNAKSLADGFGFLTGSMKALAGAFSFHQLAEYSDEIQEITERINILAKSQDEANKIFNQLVQVSQSTNVSLKQTADAYVKIGLVLKDANISQETALDLTQTLTNSFRLSGQSSEEATAGALKLAQAFTLGSVSGRQLKQILGDNEVLANLFKKAVGPDLLKQATLGFISLPKFMKIVLDNMNDINDKATELKATFGQSLTKVLDAFKIKIFELGDSISASSVFAKGVQWVIDNMGKIVPILLVIATTAIPAIVVALGSLAAGFGLLSPGIIAITALTAGLLALNPAATSVLSPIEQIDRAIGDLDKTFFMLIQRITDFAKYAPGFLGPIAKAINAIAGSVVKAEQDRLDEYDQKATKLKAAQDKLFSDSTADAAKRHAADIAKAMKAFAPDQSVQQMLAALNAEFRSGAIDIGEYNSKILSFDLAKAQKEFKEGKIDLEKLNQEIDKVQLQKLNLQFKEGILTIDQFNAATRAIGLKELNEQLESGKISLSEYNAKLAAVSDQFSAGGAFRTGLQDYVNSLGTVTTQVANAISGAFNRLEDQLLDFIKKGKFNFADFTSAILDDLSRIILRATIIKPLANAILSGLSSGGGAANSAGSSGTDYSNVAAHGLAFDHGVRKFATGGVISSPTAFNYGAGGSKTGLMGEAGPEAIIPLKRGSGGDLGVKASITPVTINVINQSGNEVQRNETTGSNGEKTIDIIITSKVREGIATGKFDAQMKNSYGLRRKGS